MYIPHEVISSSLFMIIPYITECPFFLSILLHCLFIVSSLYHLFPDIKLYDTLDGMCFTACCIYLYSLNIELTILSSLITCIEINIYDISFLKYSSFLVQSYKMVQLNNMFLFNIFITGIPYSYITFYKDGKWDVINRYLWHFFQVVNIIYAINAGGTSSPLTSFF